MIVRMLNDALRLPGACPSDLRSIPFSYDNLNNIAHTMWQTALEYEPAMENATRRAANFNIPTLQALAKLNFLPAWWLFRSFAKSWLYQSGYMVDDRMMDTLWRETTSLYRSAQPLQAPVSQETMHDPRRNSMVDQAVQQDDGGVQKVDQE
jgi:hypothetical protein